MFFHDVNKKTNQSRNTEKRKIKPTSYEEIKAVVASSKVAPNPPKVTPKKKS
jgi:hypothetical protein